MMRTRKPAKRIRSQRLFFIGLFAVAFAAFHGTGIQGAWGKDLLLGSDGPGTFSYFAGRKVSRVINRDVKGVTCTGVPTPDPVHMLTNLRTGSLDVVLVDSRTLFDAFRQKGRFRYMDIPFDNLRILCPLYEMPLTLVVRKDAGIRVLDDLRKKRVNIGAPGSANRGAADILFTAKGWSRNDFSLVGELPDSQGQDAMAFCHGTVQAMVTIGVHPNAALKQLLQRCASRFIPMNDAEIQRRVASHPAYSKMVIDAGTYPGQGDAVETFGIQGMLVTTEELNEKIALGIVTALYNNSERLRSAHPALSPASPEAVGARTMEIPLHPGAARYYQTHR